jgi:hypothetical protein
MTAADWVDAPDRCLHYPTCTADWSKGTWIEDEPPEAPIIDKSESEARIRAFQLESGEWLYMRMFRDEGDVTLTLEKENGSHIVYLLDITKDGIEKRNYVRSMIDRNRVSFFKPSAFNRFGALRKARKGK